MDKQIGLLSGAINKLFFDDVQVYYKNNQNSLIKNFKQFQENVCQKNLNFNNLLNNTVN